MPTDITTSANPAQPKRWSDSEVRRVSRVLQILIDIDQRKKRQAKNEAKDK